MSIDQVRLDALEELAAIYGDGVTLPWLEQNILRCVREAGQKPERRDALLRAALLLGHGRDRILARMAATLSPSTPAPQPNRPSVDETELLRRNTILLERYEREVATSKSYATFITGVGYAGLLAIWEGLRDHVDKTSLLYSAALIAISLMVFIFWEMCKANLAHRGDQSFQKVVAESFFTIGFESASGQARARAISESRAINRFQPLIFWISTVTGFGAACLLVWAAVVSATGMKITIG